jgi:hypothetical protein
MIRNRLLWLLLGISLGVSVCMTIMFVGERRIVLEYIRNGYAVVQTRLEGE